jgi:hypothetical protein
LLVVVAGHQTEDLVVAALVVIDHLLLVNHLEVVLQQNQK